MSKGTAAPTASLGFDVTSLDSSGAFVRNAGRVLDAISDTKVAGHIDLTATHHTPWSRWQWDSQTRPTSSARSPMGGST